MDSTFSCFDSGDVSVFIYCCYRRITGCIDKVFSCCVSGSFPLYIALFSFSDVDGIICGFFDAELHYIGSIVRSFCLFRLLGRFRFWLGRSFCLLRFLRRLSFWLYRFRCCSRFYYWFRCCWFSCSFFCDFYRNGAGCLVKGSGRFCIDLDLCSTGLRAFRFPFLSTVTTFGLELL